MNNLIFESVELSTNNSWMVSKVIFDLEGDLFNRAKSQATEKSLYTMNASQAGSARSPEMKYQRQLMGCLAEIYVQEYLKDFLLVEGLEKEWDIIRYDDVRTDEFKSPENEYDIKIEKSDKSKSFSVESRSSITRDRSIIKGIEQFDIIGPYTSHTKGGEKYNDIYIRPLYAYKDFETNTYSDLEFENLIKTNKIELYIVGGCLKENMISDGYNKSMAQYGTNYRVIKILKGKDSRGFYKILKEIVS